MISEPVNEVFLHYLWQQRLFDPTSMVSSTGENLEVLDPGIINPDSGPDFFNAKIRFGSTTWAGNVEIHMRSSDWLRHGHHLDRAYDNVILQVVMENDVEIKRSGGHPLPCAEIRYDNRLLDNYRSLVKSKKWIPCEERIEEAAGAAITGQWLENLAMERLECKSARLHQILLENEYDWEETLYRQLARNFGLKLNGLPFEMVAVNTPLKIVAKHKDNLMQVEALLFGQSGMLGKEEGDPYYLQLRMEYLYLRSKYKLEPVEGHLWKFLRLRPSNFPTIRIAQFASLVAGSWGLFSRVIEEPRPAHLRKIFCATASGYWDNHYVFNRKSIKSKKKTGRVMLNLLLINTVIPLLFLYGIKKDDKSCRERAVMLLREMEAESNSVIHKWKEFKFNVPDAYASQALMHLKEEYCNRRECLRCAAGDYLIRKF